MSDPGNRAQRLRLASVNDDTDDKLQSADLELVPGSEDALADEFATLYRHLFRFTPGMGWMRCTDSKWIRDDGLTHLDCARQVARIAAAEESNAKQRRALCSARTIAAIATIARTDPHLALDVGQWDRLPHELNTPGGIVDLRSGEIKRHDLTSYFTLCTRVAPDFEADCPTWRRFLREVFCDDGELVEFIHRLVGYCFTGERREQRIYFLQGSGANGKSTLLDFIGALAGDYMLKLPATVLMTSPVQAHPTELAQLRGKRLALSSELDEGQHWAEARIKELTGDETLTARFMRGDFFTFRQQQKHLIAGNYRPRLRGGDAALARRFVLIPFRATFTGAKRDPRLLEKLHAEAPAVLAWIIRGAVRWYAEGMAIPASVAAASAEYLSENDDLAAWLDERCVRQPSAQGKSSDLYADFSTWTKARGQHVPAMRTWAERLSVVPGIHKVKSHGVMVYRGVGLLAPGMFDD